MRAVAPGASDLLVVRLDRSRHVEVGHEADVGLVHAHPERVGRDDDRDLAAQEALLGCTPLRVVHAGVVAGRVHAVGAQREHDLLHVAPGSRVDETGATAAREREDAADLLLVAGGARHLDEEVGPVEASDENLGIVQPERADDVLSHLGRGGGGERQDALGAQVSARFGELEVVGPEIVSPRRDAVRLVDGEEGDPHLRDGVPEGAGPEPLGRDVHQTVGAGADTRLPFPALRVRQRAVHEGRRDAPCSEAVDLVLHQRDQRRRHHRGALE